jgi:hypothetical protein
VRNRSRRKEHAGQRGLMGKRHMNFRPRHSSSSDGKQRSSAHALLVQSSDASISILYGQERLDSQARSDHRQQLLGHRSILIEKAAHLHYSVRDAQGSRHNGILTFDWTVGQVHAT